MTVADPETGKPIRLSYPQKLFGQDRESVEMAYPGDIIGLVAHRSFRIGDTLSSNSSIRYHEIPRFPPEVFATIRNPNPSKFKQYRAGLDQMLNEGVIQAFQIVDNVTGSLLLGAVGQLQFDVLAYRLRSEYGADVVLEPAPFTQIRWFPLGTSKDQFANDYLGAGVRLATDVEGELVILFPDRWNVDYFLEKHPKVELFNVSPTANPVHKPAI